ncbi:threonine synthase [Rhodobacteraceae bacterium NNCM2]|nr:threonine synthase [Coraliihabitans acroporae]
MRYISTRGQAPEISFEEAMLTGLARDGGLYVPAEVPVMSAEDIAALSGLSYEETAYRVMRPFIGDTFTEAEFRSLISHAYAGFGHISRAPLVQIGDNDWVLELHHGPTLAFKDFAMQLIGQMFEAVLARRGQKITIICATSGDTGSAAAEAFGGRAGVDCVVLYPHGRVSEVQRRQMTTPTATNVHALAVEGDFDDCQALVKAMFNDFAFRDEVGLAAVNSINWARVLAQVVYYFTAAASLGAPARKVDFSVPTGNFGDIFAGHIARRMGLPIGRLIIATNENDILHRTLETGSYTRAGVNPTIAPSMDIQISSNFERLLFELYDNDGGAVRQAMQELSATGGFTLSQGALTRLREGFASARSGEAVTMAMIDQVARTGGTILDPHTAIGVVAAEQLRNPENPMVTLGTAHAAKFPDAVERACGIRPDLPPRMADLYDRPERVRVVANDLATIEDTVRECRA